MSKQLKMMILCIMLLIATACSNSAEVAQTIPTRVKIVITATPSVTPTASPTPTAEPTLTPWLEVEVPTATPLPTLSPDQINVVVTRTSDTALNQHHPTYRSLIENVSQRPQITVQDGVVSLVYDLYCGDECMGTLALALREMGGGLLPEFVSHTYSRHDLYDGGKQYQLAEGVLEIGQWDLDGVISGRIVREDNEYQWPTLVFWHDFGGQSLHARHVQGRVILVEELRTALQSGTLSEKRDALFIIAEGRHWRQDAMRELVPDLIEALADMTPIPPDGTPYAQVRFVGEEAMLTLGALASAYDATHVSNREPLLDYWFYDWAESSDGDLPTAERIAELQANWQALFDQY